MSEPVSEARPAPARASGGGIKGTFTTRIGPLPMWVWLLIITGILIAWRVMSARQTAAQATDQTGTDQVPSDQVPQFVNQTYTTVTPPVQGPPGPPGPTGPPGRPFPIPTRTVSGERVVVPKLTGTTAGQAFAVLRSEALNPGPGGIRATRKVLRTDPPAGAYVPKHTPIRVYVK